MFEFLAEWQLPRHDVFMNNQNVKIHSVIAAHLKNTNKVGSITFSFRTLA
jgi:hypothetical protein